MEGIVAQTQLGGAHRGSDWRHLTERQCALAMRIFDDYRELSDEEAEDLGKILVPVLKAIVWGAFEVIQYLKDVGTELYNPEELCHFDREVFLRDRLQRSLFVSPGES